MSKRIKKAKSIVEFGYLLNSLAFMVMRTEDLVAYSQQIYKSPTSITKWGGENSLKDELNNEEKQFLTKLPQKSGDLLMLGLGGGREAIPLARLGFSVTGVDFVPSMIENALENARKAGVRIKGLIQEFSSLNVPPESYDVVWFSTDLYSCIPTREKRIHALQMIFQALRPGGCCICQFNYSEEPPDKHKERLKRILARLSGGNLAYEVGDHMSWGYIGFSHTFKENDTLCEEFKAAGFELLDLQIDNNSGSAIIQKPTR